MEKKAEILDSEENVKRNFAEFLLHASNLMKKTQVDLPDVKLTWSTYKEISKEACQADDMPSLLRALHQGPYAYRGLSHTLTLFCGEEGEKLVAEYEEKLKDQLSSRVHEFPTRRNGKRFKVKVDRELNQDNELDFRITVAKLFKCSHKDFLLEDIRVGCTELTYIIPSEIANHLEMCIDVSVEDFKNAQILQLAVDG